MQAQHGQVLKVNASMVLRIPTGYLYTASAYAYYNMNMPACKGRSWHHARPSCFPPFGGGIIKSTEHTATPWLRAKPEDQQGKSGEKPALALDFLQAVSVERMRTKGALCPVIGKPRRLMQPRRHGQISPRRIRKPEDLRTFYSPRKMRAQNIIFNVHYKRQF